MNQYTDNRYTWISILRDGSIVQKYNEDGSTNKIDRENTKEFHLIASPEAYELGYRNFSLFLTKDQRLIYRIRRHADTSGGQLVEDLSSIVHIVGYEEDRHNEYFSAYCMLLPGGRVEWSHDLNHITRHERNLDVEPLKFYESE